MNDKARFGYVGMKYAAIPCIILDNMSSDKEEPIILTNFFVGILCKYSPQAFISDFNSLLTFSISNDVLGGVDGICAARLRADSTAACTTGVDVVLVVGAAARSILSCADGVVEVVELDDGEDFAGDVLFVDFVSSFLFDGVLALTL